MATRIVDLGSVIGPQGPQGPAGAAGTQGPQGAAGAAGKNAYQYAEEGGYSGTEAQFKAKLAKEYLPLGGGDMAGIIDMNNKVITGLPSPVAPSDAVNYHALVAMFLNAEINAQAYASVIRGTVSLFRGYVSMRKVTFYGTDVIFYVSGSFPTQSGGGIIDRVTITLPEIFKMGQEWSDMNGYSGLFATYNGSSYDMSPSGNSSYIEYSTSGIFGQQQKDAEVKISGYIRVGVNA